ncbi:thioredoxin domain-containing protein [Streptacidiphilus pinicola]|uniref:thioredoxin domain-containing protein n=1 Tax=Streptacidiphilus pinicola TaxID=2219663 RepID=UPI0010579265|nr:thioredoxin domain-containing protein [Streptacidiphilus pinicola]
MAPGTGPRTSRRRRRNAVVAGAVAVALVAGSGVAWAVVANGARDGETAAVVPAHASGPDGTVISYGKADAPNTVAVYEDMRCPFCEKFETALGPTLTALADQGKLKIDFHMAAFLDKGLGGKGSKTALAALGAALNESPQKFKQYHDVLYRAQPKQETTDTYGSTATLLELADKVDGLRTPEFNKAVKEGTYLPWTQQVADAFYKSDVTGTPTVKVNGTRINVIGPDREAIPVADFTAQLDAALK